MLIEIAGIDGAGKSTLIAAIRGHLTEQGRHVYHRCWPSTVKRIATDIAHAAAATHWRDTFTPESIETATAFEACTAVHQHLLPLDMDRQVIITDTYTATWLATAALNGARDLNALAAIYARLPTPDLSLHLHLAPATARQRLYSRPSRDHLTTLGDPARLQRFADAFARTTALLTYTPHVLNAEAPAPQVWQQAQALLEHGPR